MPWVISNYSLAVLPHPNFGQPHDHCLIRRAASFRPKRRLAVSQVVLATSQAVYPRCCGTPDTLASVEK